MLASPSHVAILKEMARKYVWWKTPDAALQYPERIILQVLDIGDFHDAQKVLDHFGEDRLRDIVRHSDPGALNDRSWTYWHYRLGMATRETLPDRPVRRFGP